MTQRTANPLTANQIKSLFAKSSRTSAEHRPYLQRALPVDDVETDAEFDARYERMFDEMYPGRREQEDALENWRGINGSYIENRERPWLAARYWFIAGSGMMLPDGLTARAIPPSYNLTGALRKAKELDGLCTPVGVDPAHALALKRIVRDLCVTARKRAKQIQLPFDLTSLDIEALLWSQGMCCALSGVPFRPDAAGADHFRAPFRPSLDRIKSSEGYVRGNIRLVLTLVNLAMNDWGEAPLIEIARAIAAKHPAPHCGD